MWLKLIAQGKTVTITRHRGKAVTITRPQGKTVTITRAQHTHTILFELIFTIFFYIFNTYTVILTRTSKA